ncbi:MAG: hypothetical protein Q9200_004722 [Gallowayella weberi]
MAVLFRIFGYKYHPIRIICRNPGAFTVCVCSFLYLLRYRSTAHVRHEGRSTWSDAPRRLIVFGDSWRDNGKYPIDLPRNRLLPLKDEIQGPVWTEWLCSAVSSSTRTTSLGAVVNIAVLNRTLPARNKELMLSDLKTQASQWLRFEGKQYTSSWLRVQEKRGTIFTVWFSLRDIWYSSQLNDNDASGAIRQSVDILFEQLDTIADSWPTGAKIILPEAMDPTFLPGWSMKRTEPGGLDDRGDEQRNAIQLVRQWNAARDRKASGWDKGQIYIHNTNDWMLNQVREAQLVVGDMIDHNGLGQSGSPWDSVHSGCVSGGKTGTDGDGGGSAGRCSDPAKCLFW